MCMWRLTCGAYSCSTVGLYVTSLVSGPIRSRSSGFSYVHEENTHTKVGSRTLINAHRTLTRVGTAGALLSGNFSFSFERTLEDSSTFIEATSSFSVSWGGVSPP